MSEFVNNYKIFKNSYEMWKSLQRNGADHILSPMHPDKVAMKNHALRWKLLAEKHKDIFEFYEEETEFQRMFEFLKNNT